MITHDGQRTTDNTRALAQALHRKAKRFRPNRKLYDRSIPCRLFVVNKNKVFLIWRILCIYKVNNRNQIDIAIDIVPAEHKAEVT